MDGNRRFGLKVHNDPLQGHWVGGQSLIDFSQWCMSAGVEVLTVYAFSTENWSRDPGEVQVLMGIFAKYADNFQKEALSRNVKVQVLSTDRDRLPSQVLHSIAALQTATENCSGFLVNLCISYGSRAELVRACRSLASEVEAGRLSPEDIDETAVSAHLLTGGLPDPDILIRTSGEFRSVE